MNLKILRTGTLAVAVLAAACEHLPTSSPAADTHNPAVQPSRASDTGLHLGEAPFTCVVGRLAATGQFSWEARKQTVFFPRAELAANGQTVRYSYVMVGPTQPLRSADCVIPKSESAIRRMDQFFGANAPGAKRFQTSRKKDDGVQLMGCASDGLCALQGLVVTVPSTSPSVDYDLLPDCTMGCNDWWNGSGSFTGGGSYGGWTSYGDTDSDGDYTDEGPIAFGICVAAALGPDGWLAIGGTALGAYELWGAHVDVMNAINEYYNYHDLQDSPDPQTRAQWNEATDTLYKRRITDAESSEQSLWNAVALSSVYTSAELAKAVTACAVSVAAPI